MAPSVITDTYSSDLQNGKERSILPATVLTPPGFSYGVPTLDMGKQTKPIHQIRYPSFKTFEEERRFLKLHHAAALRWLGTHGYGEEGAGGHMTVRDPEFTDHLWINPFGRSFKHLRPEDLCLVNDEGEVVAGNMHAVNPAGFYIHSAIHRSRPEVRAVVHMHTTPGKAFSVFGKEIEMLNQDCCQFFEAHAVFPGFDGFVLADEESLAISKALGPVNKAIILQNHGLLCVGASPDAAAFTFGAFNRCIEAQLLSENYSQSRSIQPIKISSEQARGVKQFYTDEFQWLTFQPAFEDMVRASNGELTMESGGEIFPEWNDV